jgi:transposase InsO family protein
VLEIHKGRKKPSGRTQLTLLAMALRPNGGRHSEAHAPGKRKLQIHSSRGRLLHQTGRSRALSVHHDQSHKKFLWKMVVCRFRIPYALVADNGTQFDCRPFQDWCSELKIRHFFSLVYHLQANGQVEATNKTLVKTLTSVSAGSLVVLPNHYPYSNIGNSLFLCFQNRSSNPG